MSIKANQKGFTLLELIIVVSVISILALAGIFSFSFVQVNARNAKRKADLKELANALESYKARNSVYPSTCTTAGEETCGYSSTAWRGICGAFNAAGTYTDSGTDGYIPDLSPEFIPKLPHDPRENNANPNRGQTNCTQANSNCYIYKSTGVDYKILAFCTPEGQLSTEDSFFDPVRYCETAAAGCTAGAMWAWQVSSGQYPLENW